jgi:hypothetical protein
VLRRPSELAGVIAHVGTGAHAVVEYDYAQDGHVQRVVLWVLEILAILLVALLLTLPMQDYARREHLRWYLNPSAENWQTFQCKQHEEFFVRLGIATPIAFLTLFFGFRLRSKSRQTR